MPNTKNNKTIKKSKVAHNHAYKGCRDAIQPNTPSPTPAAGALVLTTSSTGNLNCAGVLCPMGLTGVVLGSGVYTAPTANGNILAPTLRGLYNKAISFQWYRVTRAKLVFIGNLASTTTGSISMVAYTDPADVLNIPYPAYNSGPNTKVFDLANVASKEISIPIPVDSSWKRCSSILSVVGNIYPFSSTSAATVVNVNTAGDLSFGAWSIFITGAPATTATGSVYVDYDVEFKSPIDPGVNY